MNRRRLALWSLSLGVTLPSVLMLGVLAAGLVDPQLDSSVLWAVLLSVAGLGLVLPLWLGFWLGTRLVARGRAVRRGDVAAGVLALCHCAALVGTQGFGPVPARDLWLDDLPKVWARLQADPAANVPPGSPVDPSPPLSSPAPSLEGVIAPAPAELGEPHPMAHDLSVAAASEPEPEFDGPDADVRAELVRVLRVRLAVARRSLAVSPGISSAMTREAAARLGMQLLSEASSDVSGIGYPAAAAEQRRALDALADRFALTSATADWSVAQRALQGRERAFFEAVLPVWAEALQAARDAQALRGEPELSHRMLDAEVRDRSQQVASTAEIRGVSATERRLRVRFDERSIDTVAVLEDGQWRIGWW